MKVMAAVGWWVRSLGERARVFLAAGTAAWHPGWAAVVQCLGRLLSMLWWQVQPYGWPLLLVVVGRSPGWRQVCAAPSLWWLVLHEFPHVGTV